MVSADEVLSTVVDCLFRRFLQHSSPAMTVVQPSQENCERSGVHVADSKIGGDRNQAGVRLQSASSKSAVGRLAILVPER